MKTNISGNPDFNSNLSTAFLYENTGQLDSSFLTVPEKKYLSEKTGKDPVVFIFRYPTVYTFIKIDKNWPVETALEKTRKAGAIVLGKLKDEKAGVVQVQNFLSPKFSLAFSEGLVLSAYNFDKYKTEKEEFCLQQILLTGQIPSNDEIDKLSVVLDAVCIARGWVNEPLSGLTAEKLSEEISRLGAEAGFNVEVFGKARIRSLKMGGLLAVNRGSVDPPTFSVLEWKPENPTNTKPVVLIGKGIVFDTGGLSLKPTRDSMDYMKSDMGGAAAIAATIYALAKTKTPVHVIGLVPATDNRPGGNACVPGDIIVMSDGTTVEVKNTDAEGRLILADALLYAKRYAPSLVIDVATLTGSAAMISGFTGIVGMGNCPAILTRLKNTGSEVYERIIELPLWDEFAESLKSPVADLSNLGKREGQAVTAGKFLEHFTGYPWIHLDIAGSAFIFENDGYRPKGATGVGIRLLFNFLKEYASTQEGTLKD